MEMARILGFLMVLGLGSFVEAMAQSPPPREVYDEYKATDLRRVLPDRSIDLVGFLEKKRIVIQLKSTANIADILKAFSLTKVNENQNYFVVSPSKILMGEARYLGLINNLLKDERVVYVSPVFRFEEGLVWADGKIIVGCKKTAPCEEMWKVIAQSAKLGMVKFHPESLTMTYFVTSESGRNPFAYANLLDPSSGELRTSYASVNFLPLDEPIEVFAAVRTKKKSPAGGLIYDPLVYVLTISAMQDRELNLDELSTKTSFLKSWRPERLPKELFTFFGDYKIVEKSKKDGRVKTVLEYELAITKTGDFILPPMKVSYWEIDQTEGGKKVLREVSSAEVLVKIGSILPEDANWITDIKDGVEFTDQDKTMAQQEGGYRQYAWVSYLMFVLTFILGIVLITEAGAYIWQKMKVTASHADSAYRYWHERRLELGSMEEQEFRSRFPSALRSLVGILLEGDGSRFAGLSSGSAARLRDYDLSWENISELRKLLFDSELANVPQKDLIARADNLLASLTGKRNV